MKKPMRDQRKNRQDLEKMLEECRSALEEARASLQAEKTARRREEELLEEHESKAFQIIAEAAVHGDSIPALCTQILSGLISALGFDFGAVRLYDEDKQVLQPVALFGLTEAKKKAMFKPQSLDDPHHLAAFVARTRQAIFAPDVKRHEIARSHGARLKELGAQSVITWPILNTRRDLLGIIYLMSWTVKEIPEWQRVFFETVVRMFSIVLERRQAEDELQASREDLLRAQRVARMGFLTWNLKTNEIYWSDETFTLFGIDRKKVRPLAEMTLQLVHPDDRIEVKERLDRAIQGIQDFDSSHRILRPDGSVIWVQAQAELTLDEKGNPESLLGTVIDATKYKQAEECVRTSLREKEILLKEIHHRVKNNMQVISSLLSLQARYINEPRVREFCLESQDRIKSMALVHEMIYNSNDLAHIDFGGYLTTLVTHLAHSHRKFDISSAFEIEAINFDTHTAIPCGLIVNELVANAFKHAFQEGREGTLRVKLQRSPDNIVTLVVGDNGRGFPDDLDFRNPPSLGLQLVNDLVAQIDGSIELDGTEGTMFTIQFKIEE